MKLKLYIFAISHYCEKARWALDYLGIEYELVHLAPGLHAKFAKDKGLTKSALPILEIGAGEGGENEMIQGSEKIIDWAEQLSHNDRCLTPSDQKQKVMEIEKRLGDKIGVHVRRAFYSEALVEFPSSVRPIFTRDLSLPWRILVTLMWSKISQKMIQRMDLGYQQGEESKQVLAEELDWLETQLPSEDSFLVGYSFSRADITAAALLARLAFPNDHPLHKDLNRPPRLEELAQQWSERPALKWVRRVYAEYRDIA